MTLSPTHLDQLQIRSHLLDQLNAQIAVYSGIPGGGLAALQTLYTQLQAGVPMRCRGCGRLLTHGHRDTCPIVAAYLLVVGQEGGGSLQ